MNELEGLSALNLQRGMKHGKPRCMYVEENGGKDGLKEGLKDG